jgi:hypothetical protein
VDIGEAVSSLGASITSPAKLAFIGYVVLVYAGKIPQQPTWLFIVIAVSFILTQVVHDDYLRILLNGKAKLQVEVESRKLGPL